MKISAHIAIAVAIACALSDNLAAHVGSPDVFLEGQAGAYRLLVTVRPPKAIPGVADVEVLTTSDDVRDVRIVPLPLAGDGAKFAPIPDRAAQSADDKRLFTGHLWLMGAGSWQVRVHVTGDRGEGTLSVPVPTLPQTTLAMAPAVRMILFVFMLLLASGFVAIVSAMAREAKLGEGEVLDDRARRRGRIAGAIAAVVMGGVIFLGNMWWGVEATAYDRYVYKPLTATPSIVDNDVLRLTLHDPGWIGSRRVDDFVADHDHLMHLFVLSPSLDRFWHLHPEQVATGVFDHPLPPLPAGEYELFGDLVHATGVPETVTATLHSSGVATGRMLADDAGWLEGTRSSTRIEWVRGNGPLVAKKLTLFTFKVDDASGQPVNDLELYMGMPGHAVFVKRDRKVFAHVHPSGSASIAAMQIAMPDANMHAQHSMAAPSTVSFPYGFPEAGDYRIFVQVKRAGEVVTGAFDAKVQ